MTCIAGLVHDKAVWIGGDSAGVSERLLSIRADEKVFRSGDFLFGFSSSFRFGQILRYALKPPEADRTNLDLYMATTFVNELRRCLHSHGHAKRTNEQEDMDGDCLVGYQDRLYAIYSDYQVARFVDGMAAIGCGGQVAVGALYATRDFAVGPKERVRLALEASERFNSGVRAPFTIMTTLVL